MGGYAGPEIGAGEANGIATAGCCKTDGCIWLNALAGAGVPLYGQSCVWEGSLNMAAFIYWLEKSMDDPGVWAAAGGQPPWFFIMDDNGDVSREL